jgi:hypothetical protein
MATSCASALVVSAASPGDAMTRVTVARSGARICIMECCTCAAANAFSASVTFAVASVSSSGVGEFFRSVNWP